MGLAARTLLPLLTLSVCLLLADSHRAWGQEAPGNWAKKDRPGKANENAASRDSKQARELALLRKKIALLEAKVAELEKTCRPQK